MPKLALPELAPFSIRAHRTKCTAESMASTATSAASIIRIRSFAIAERADGVAIRLSF